MRYPSALVACNSSEGAPDPTLVVTAIAPSPTPAARADDPGAAIAGVVQACRTKDAAALRGLIAGDVTDQEIQQMFAQGQDVQLISQSIPEESGDRATIDVTLRITHDSGETVVQRSWDVARGEDGGWRLTSLADCY